MFSYLDNVISFLKRGGGLFFLCLIFSVVTGCHHKGKAISPLTQEGKPALRRIAVVPFQQIIPEEDNTKTVRCPLCGAIFLTEKSPEDAEKVVEGIFVQELEKQRKVNLIPPERVNGIYRRISAESFKTTLPEILKKVGNELEADGIVVGYVYRYRERRGRPYSVEKPASVAFDIHLVRVSDGTLLWKGTFDRTQSSLLEDIFLISSFFKHRGRWATAEELTKEGIEKIMGTFPQGR
jgi:TolB-like protein